MNRLDIFCISWIFGCALGQCSGSLAYLFLSLFLLFALRFFPPEGRSRWRLVLVLVLLSFFFARLRRVELPSLPKATQTLRVKVIGIKKRRGKKEALLFSEEGPAWARGKVFVSRGLDQMVRSASARSEEDLMDCRFQVRGRFRLFDHTTLPGLFDEESYQQRQGHWAVLDILHPVLLQRGAGPGRWMEELRGRIRKACEPLGKPGASFFRRILLGSEEGLGKEIKEPMKELGMLHLLAASGLHISLLFSTGLHLLSLVTGKRQRAVLFLFSLLFFYATLLGFPPSILRALLFVAAKEFALWRRRKTLTLRTLLFAATVLLVLWPASLFQPGFQLSFLCALGIYYGNLRQSYHPFSGGFLQTLRISFWIQLFTLPVLLLQGGSLSPVSLLANFIQIPFFTGLFRLGLLALCLAPLPMIGFVLCKFTQWGYFFFLRVMDQLLGMNRIFTLPDIHLSASASLAWLLFLLLLMEEKGPLFTRKPGPPSLSEAFFLRCQRLRLQLVLPLLLLFPLSQLLPLSPDHALISLDVGQGDCTCLRDGEHAYLVDTGGVVGPAGKQESQKLAKGVVRELENYGVNRLDGIFLSHFDRDHVGALPYLCKELPVTAIYCAPGKRTAKQDALLPKGIPHRVVSPGLFSEEKGGFSPGSFWSVWVVFTGRVDQEDSNSGSMILLAKTKGEKGKTVLFMGDKEDDGELLPALERKLTEPLTLLKCAHHGSKRGSGAPFLKRIRPRQALISCGRNNSYGHPDPQTLRRLRRTATCYRTDQNGSMAFLEAGGDSHFFVQKKEDRLRESVVFLAGLLWILLGAWQAVFPSESRIKVQGPPLRAGRENEADAG